MHLLLLARYGPLGSASRVRFYQYLPYLQAHGLKITVCPLLADEYVQNLYTGQRQSMAFLARAYFTRLRALLTSQKFDLIWLEKEALPWLPAWFENILTRIPVVVDYDDAVFHRYDLHANPLIRALLGRKIDGVMRHAAVVVAGNDYLAARAKQAGAKRIEILPSVVDTTRYQPANQVTNQLSPFTIGWIGAPVTAPYLQQIQPALAELCANGNARVILVGSGNVTLPGVPVEIRPWTEATEAADIQTFDVGIMPLPDEPFERGKCGYKLIQYMACALPVVASPIGVNQKIVEPGINGFLATMPEEWITALQTLRENPALRAQMGLAGREKVEQFYSLQANAPKLLNLLQNVERRA
ncbi:MAG TPA: glycosyltransferase family 4 protein [Anaerolineales bacterium]|nr:glycosyltransferase family 4 protein [Anaerolineales bacterium]